MKITLYLFVLFLPQILFAQLTVKGTVTDATSKEPIAGANVFISNTSYATLTDKDGHFSFSNINIQKGDLIVNALGYSHGVFPVNTSNAAAISISLTPQSKELAAVTVGSFDKNGYKKWGSLYFSMFIGQMPEAAQCKILNPNVLKFYYDKNSAVLDVYASEPIRIQNKALGYEIDYTAENFSYDTKQHLLFFSGYPAFSEMTGSDKKILKWRLKRNECYRGSVLHFMRSVYRNRLLQEGFEIYAAKKIEYKEKARVKKIMYRYNGDVLTVVNTAGIDPDSLSRYNKVLAQEDSLFIADAKPLLTDSFAYGIDSVTAGMYFRDHILVKYRSVVAPGSSAENKTFYSYAKLLDPAQEIKIFPNGSFDNPVNFFTEQYWGNAERMCRALPFDFVYDSRIIK